VAAVRWGLLIGLVGAAFFLYLGAAIFVGIGTDAQCKRLGWKSGDLTWRFERFCVSRINQTDVVVPLSEARSRRPGVER
jgi:hypothetical protein